MNQNAIETLIFNMRHQKYRKQSLSPNTKTKLIIKIYKNKKINFMDLFPS